MSCTLRQDVAPSSHLSAICSRNRYARNPAPSSKSATASLALNIILAEKIGKWADYYDDEHTAVLVAAIIADVPRLAGPRSSPCKGDW